MRDPERTLRDLFERKVAELGLSAEGPSPSIVRRVRIHQVVSAFTALAVVAGLAVGSFAGLRALVDVSRKPVIKPSLTSPPTPSRPGGLITVGTREYPECLNPLTGCASATGTWWTVLEHVMPRAMELDSKGYFVPSPLLVEAPSLENGGLTEDPFTIRFHLDPNADWADGTPI
ncbi:MAG TPA: hypothetical protein VGR13_07870, partial [Actinomycetota bacterium]|nr:hypothetical protein [Actinomycetota bacterium]